MRHIPIEDLVELVLDVPDCKRDRQRLLRAHQTLMSKAERDRKRYIDKNGSSKWSPIKNRLTEFLGHKCWYTESELVGGDLTIDHFRPSSRYWWLAFDFRNYRVACPFANSPRHNPERGVAGGKGAEFPLLPPGLPARSQCEIATEKPVLLDPCLQEDCELLSFQADGRPVLNPIHADDAIAGRRVDESKVLLNLDHPAFNSKREQLYHAILDDVTAHEELPEDSPSKERIRLRIAERISKGAPFSMAARQYLSFHRYLGWVDELLMPT